MRRVFADTHFYVALLNRDDPAHPKARAWAGGAEAVAVVTTSWILTETANALSKSHRRAQCGQFLTRLTRSERTKVVPLSEELQGRGLELYISRPDKEWSLTDCISFVVMADEGLTEALTNDRHFGQAGFTALLADR